MGDVEDENGTPTPKKGRRGRKRKMQSRKDDDDDDETGSFEHNRRSCLNLGKELLRLY